MDMPYPDWDRQLDSLKVNDPDMRLIAHLKLNGTRFDSVGVRYKGNSSYFKSREETYKKLPFNIKLNYVVDGQRLETKQTNLKLSNGFLDPSFIRDPLGYSVVRQYMPSPECNFTRLYINNVYWGLYANAESIDSKFLRKHFGTDKGHLVKCDPADWKKVRSQNGCPKGENASLNYLNDNPSCYAAFYEVDETEAWKPLLKLIKTLKDNPNNIESVLDVDQTLWMLAINNVLVNLDSYNGSLSHNYYLWFDTTGVAHPLIWDLNLCFGGWRRDAAFKVMENDALIQYHPLAESTNPKRPLIAQLLKNPLYKKIYLAHYNTIVHEHLSNGALIKRAETFKREIDAWVQKDSLKLYPYDAFQKSLTTTFTYGQDRIIGIQELMEPRAKWLAQLELLQKKGPEISQVTDMLTDSTCMVQASVQQAQSVWLCYRNAPEFAFKRIPMDIQGDVYQAIVPRNSMLHYYILAENAEAAATLPERASFEFKTVKSASN